MIVLVFMICAASILAQVLLKKLSLRQNSHADILLGSSNLCDWRRQWHPTPILLPGKMSWTKEPGRLQSMESLRDEHY